MTQKRSRESAEQSPDDRIEQVARLCQDLNRTLRGHNGEPGLVTQVALLQREMSRLHTLLQNHLDDHKLHRRSQKKSWARIGERVLVWVLITILYLAGIGGATLILQSTMPQSPTSEGAPAVPTDDIPP